MEMYRQGDVLLVKTALSKYRRDFASKTVHEKEMILALGEATGHAHRLQAEGGVTELNIHGETYATLGGPAVVTHEEHGTLEIPAGEYQIIRQRQYIEGRSVTVGD